MIISASSGCKINWFLKVTGKRADGYHLIDTLFQYLPFPSDEIALDLDAAPGIRVHCGGADMPQDLDNLAGKAAFAYARGTGLQPAWRIVIDKRVPAAAGLGGGSADAGAVLRLLNGHYGLLNGEELNSLAAGIGADVPFFLEPGLARGRGIGAELTRLDAPENLPGVLIVFPGFPASAKWAYSRLAPGRIGSCGAETPLLLAGALRGGDVRKTAELMHNDLEYSLFEKFPLLEVVRQELLDCGAERVMVSGSGSSLFALFDAGADREGAQQAMRKLFSGDPEAKIFASGAWAAPSRSAAKKSAFFLDRDGVVIRQVSYLHDPEQVELEKNVPEALRLIHEKGMLAVVVTNQSGVARGMFSREDVEKVHAKIQTLLAPYGERIDGFFTCFHHPDYTGPCACRKPAPGLFLEAAEALDIDLSSSSMAGDKFSDLESGRNAGVRQSFLLMTGYGPKYIDRARTAGFAAADDLLAAAKDFLGEA